jgi:hypothetical protein
VEFQPVKHLQSVCGFGCAIELGLKNKQAKEKNDYRIEKERQKNRGDWLREAQQVFNHYIRERDKAKGYGCISCGTRQGKENAGHFRSVGSCPELRFNEENVHLQCERCNTYLHSNAIAYRLALIQRIGLERVECLEGHHEAKKYTIEDLKVIKSLYKQKLKELIE